MTLTELRARERPRHQIPGLGMDPELLPELADERGFGPLALLNLAAGKFPKPGHVPALGALLEEHASVRADQGRRNYDQAGARLGQSHLQRGVNDKGERFGEA